MRVDQIHDALNLLEDDFIEEVQQLRMRKKKNNIWKTVIPLVACFCCFIVIALGAKDTINQGEYEETTTQQQTEIKEKIDKLDGIIEETPVSPIRVDKDKRLETFSYRNDIAQLNGNQSGVISEEFENTKKTKVTNQKKALQVAMFECTIEYTSTEVAYDRTEKIWKVTFWSSETAGGCQTVYLNRDGITQLIVYGE